MAVRDIILSWLKEHPGSTAREVGDACFKHSLHGKTGHCAKPQHCSFRARWASKILQALKKQGLVRYEDINARHPKWSIVKKDTFTAVLGFGKGGLAVSEFCKLVEVITDRYGEGVMISECDKEAKMHFSLNNEHLGFIDINTGSLVWDKGAS